MTAIIPTPWGRSVTPIKIIGERSIKKLISNVEESRELTDDELENVIGGAAREFFLDWVADTYNDHRKEQYDKQIDEERKRPRYD